MGNSCQYWYAVLHACTVGPNLVPRLLLGPGNEARWDLSIVVTYGIFGHSMYVHRQVAALSAGRTDHNREAAALNCDHYTQIPLYYIRTY